MSGKRVWIAALLAAIGLAAGTSLGLWYGWEANPVEYTDTDMAYLHPIYQDEYLLMVSVAYALDRDLNTARARVALLALPDPVGAVADLAERAIARDAPLEQIRALAQLAAAMGAQHESLLPYLSVDEAP